MADYYASSGGSAGGDGSLGDPWDLATAFAATATVGAGDTLWLMEQSYTGRFTVALSGTDDANRVEVRPYDGYVVIDMVGSVVGTNDQGMYVTGDFIDFWDIWVTSSNEDRWQEQEDGGWWVDGDGVRLFFCPAYDTGRSGYSWFSEAEGGLIHGGLSINNGYDDTDDGHGHGIYTQNNGNATKTLDLTTFAYNFGGSSVHAYTQAGQLEGFVIKRNVCVERLLIGGGQPVDDADVDGNHVLRTDLDMGYGPSVENGTATVTDNVTPGGAIGQAGTWASLTITGTVNGSTRNAVDIMASEYDADRAVVVVYDAAGANAVNIDLSGLSLTVDREYVLAHYLNPLAQGYTFTWDGSTPVTVRTDAEWIVATPLGHDGADEGSQAPVPLGSAPDGRMAFLLAPAARWPAALQEPTVPDPYEDPDMATPDEISGLHSWWKANAIVASDADPIQNWTDSSGNGNTLTQATESKRPTYQAGELNGYPVVRLDGSNDRLAVTFGGGAISQPNTVIILAKVSATYADRYLLDGIVNTSRHTQHYASDGTYRAYAGFSITGSAGGTGWELRIATYNGASSSLVVNGEEVAFGNAGAHTLTGLSLGASYNDGGFTQIPADVAEILIYDGLLSAGDITSLTAYFDAKYDLGLLPSRRGLPGHRAPWIGVGIGV